jgi:hypothetical protein
VEQYIAVGVAEKALRVFELEAADAQRDSRFKNMRVPAKSDALFHRYC